MVLILQMTYIKQKNNFLLKASVQRVLMKHTHTTLYVSAYSRLCPWGIVPMEDRAHSGLCPLFKMECIRDQKWR